MAASDLVQGVTGALAGMAALTITYPLYTVTMTMQSHLNEGKNDSTVVESGNPNISPSKRGKRHSPSGVQLLLSILRRKGLEGLFKGVKYALLAQALQSAVYYYFFAFFKRFHQVTGKHVPIMSFLTAAEAGVATVLVTNPFWEINMQQVTSGSDKEAKTLSGVFAEKGIRGLYAGVVPALILVSSPMTQFYFESLILRLLSKGGPVNKTLLREPMFNLLVGAWSKALSTVVTFPIQTARTMMIAKTNDTNLTDDEKRRYSNIFKCAKRIINIKGGMGLYSGLSAKIFQTSLNAALLLVFRLQMLRVIRASVRQ